MTTIAPEHVYMYQIDLEQSNEILMLSVFCQISRPRVYNGRNKVYSLYLANLESSKKKHTFGDC